MQYDIELKDYESLVQARSIIHQRQLDTVYESNFAFDKLRHALAYIEEQISEYFNIDNGI